VAAVAEDLEHDMVAVVVGGTVVVDIKMPGPLIWGCSNGITADRESLDGEVIWQRRTDHGET